MRSRIPHGKHEQDKEGTGSREARWLLIILLLASAYGVYRIARPFLHAIILGLLLSSIFHPLHQWVRRKVDGRDNIAAFLSVLLVSLLVIVPASLFLAALINQGIDTFQRAQEWLAAGNLQDALESDALEQIMQHPRVMQVREWIRPQLEGVQKGEFDLANRLISFSQKALRFAATSIVPVLFNTGALLFHFFLTLFVMFYAFRDGRRILKRVLHLSPLSASQEEQLLDRIRLIARAAVLGTFVTAAAQAAAGMVAFQLVSIPALFWGTVLGMASLVPVVGTALVWVPATAYLVIVGRYGPAVFLAIWCMAVVGSIDNFLRPILMHGRTGMSSIVLFMAILGGIQWFGPIGIIYGPLLFGLLAVCLYIYEMENATFLSRQDRR